MKETVRLYAAELLQCQIVRNLNTSKDTISNYFKHVRQTVLAGEDVAGLADNLKVSF